MLLAVFTALVGLTIAPSEIDPLLGSIAVLAIAAGAGAAGVQRTPCAGVGASDVGRGLDLADRSGSCRAWRSVESSPNSTHSLVHLIQVRSASQAEW
jgi:hypothetical protein